MRILSTCLSLAVLSLAGHAQITKAPASPHVKLTQQVGVVDVTLDYSRPGVKGRKIFGELEPFGRVWRTGANAATKISFGGDVQLGGQDVPAGDYALATIPDKKSWTVILHRNTKLWGAGGYDPKDDQLRLTIPVEHTKALTETFTIDFESFHLNGATMVLAWEHTRIAIPFVVDSDAVTLAEIDEKIRNAEGDISAQTYFDAAMFLYAKKRDLADAQLWLDKAVELSPNAFWMIYFQGEQAFLRGDRKAALISAKRALKMAKASPAGGYGYISKSEMLVKRIKKAK